MTDTSGSRRAGPTTALVLALAALAPVTVFGACARDAGPGEGTSPPPPAQAARAQLTRDLVVLTGEDLEGRGVGTSGGRLAGEYLRDRMGQAGLAPAGTDGYEQRFVAKRGDTALDGVNLVAVVPNRRLDQPAHDPTTCSHPLVVLTAHYDHLGKRGQDVFNGADDNASGVAAALWIAEQSVGSDAPFHLLLALLDAEEVGLQGARALLDHWPDDAVKRIVTNLNLDMIGRSDAGILWVAGAAHTPWLEPVVAALEQSESIDVRGGRDTPGEPPDWTQSSDHAVFHRAGVPFLYFGVDDHPDYHRPTDDLDKLDLDFLTASAEVVRFALRRIEHQMKNGGIEPSG